MAVIPSGWSLDPHQHKTESDAQQQREVQRELMPNRRHFTLGAEEISGVHLFYLGITK